MPVKQNMVPAAPVQEEVRAPVVWGLDVAEFALAHVGEVGLVHQCVADGPGVGEVPLLVAEIVVVSETRNVGASCFKSVVGIEFTVVVEVVVGGEALMVIDLCGRSER